MGNTVRFEVAKLANGWEFRCALCNERSVDGDNGEVPFMRAHSTPHLANMMGAHATVVHSLAAERARARQLAARADQEALERTAKLVEVSR